MPVFFFITAVLTQISMALKVECIICTDTLLMLPQEIY